MAPGTRHQPCLEGLTEEDMVDMGKAVQGTFLLGSVAVGPSECLVWGVCLFLILCV